MLLAIDIGNTNTVFAVYKGSELLEFWRCRTAAARSGDEYAAFLERLFGLAGLTFSNVKDVIVSSVVPEANFHLRRFCGRYIGRAPVFVAADMLDVAVDLDRPDEIGADRLVNAVAIRAFYRSPAVVIDFGTATTFDVIDAQGRYAGGAIAPGVNLSVSALHQAAARLPKVSIRRPPGIIGKNTVHAIQSGLYWGYIGLIEGITARMAEDLGEKPFVLATGGLAPLFAESTDCIDAADEELTLKGLERIYQALKNK